MPALWSRSVAEFLAADPAGITRMLAEQHAALHPTTTHAWLRARAAQVQILRNALAGKPDVADWLVLLGYAVPRLEGRADAVLVLPGVVMVLAFAEGAQPFLPVHRRRVEDHALDLQDFHRGCRGQTVIPVLVGVHATPAQVPAHTGGLMLAGAAAPVLTTGAELGSVFVRIAARAHRPSPKAPAPRDWDTLPYRPAPGLIEAARITYARHAVPEIARTLADAPSLDATSAAIAAAVHNPALRPTVLFVTGIPGAGKTLCGLRAAFGPDAGGVVFLTGNPTLVTVLREALARDQATRGRALAAARRRMEAVIQALPRFREHYAATGTELPSERIAVIDEAQRCWSRDQALRKTRDRPRPLTDAEPGALLDIMARRPDAPVVVCLVGGGQEIHDGEGGLAEWGAALARRPAWRVLAAREALEAADPRQRLPALPALELCDALQLNVPFRAVRSADAVAWVDAVLDGDAQAASALAPKGTLPFAITRSLHDMRQSLRLACRGTRRAGLVASSGAARLRAEGLGAVLPHQDTDAVARWFLDRWPDIRASDALEVAATEFAIQGLELDQVGLAWDGDLTRNGGRWQARAFRGAAWISPRQPDRVRNRFNAYRVLLTRARVRTVIWVPPGSPDDPTRCPARLDETAEFLLACGATKLDPAAEKDLTCDPIASSQRSWL